MNWLSKDDRTDWAGIMPTPPMPTTTEQLEAVTRTYFLASFMADPSHAGNGASEMDVADAAIAAWDDLEKTPQGKHRKYVLKNAMMPLVVSATGPAYNHLREHMSQLIRDAAEVLEDSAVNPAGVPLVHTEDALAVILISDPSLHVVARRLMNLLGLK